jgi:hypothetical protein
MSKNEAFFDFCGTVEDPLKSESVVEGKDNIFLKARKIISERHMISKSRKKFSQLYSKPSEFVFNKIYDKNKKETSKIENIITPFQRIRQISDNKKKFILNKIKNTHVVKEGLNLKNVIKAVEIKPLNLEKVSQFSISSEMKKYTVYSSFDSKNIIKQSKLNKSSKLIFGKCISERTKTNSKASDNIDLLLNGLNLQQSITFNKNFQDNSDKTTTEDNIVSHFRLSETKLPKIHGKLIHFNSIQTNVYNANY